MTRPRIALRVRISWGDYPLHDVVLDPPRGFTLGEGRDFELPREALGADELEWIRVDGDRVLVSAATGVDLNLGWQPLALGERLARRVGAFVIDVSVEKSAPRPYFGWFAGRNASD
jgi:hypothetical protein